MTIPDDKLEQWPKDLLEQAAEAYGRVKQKWAQDGERFTEEDYANGIGFSLEPSKIKGFRAGAKWAREHDPAVRELCEALANIHDELLEARQQSQCPHCILAMIKIGKAVSKFEGGSR